MLMIDFNQLQSRSHLLNSIISEVQDEGDRTVQSFKRDQSSLGL